MIYVPHPLIAGKAGGSWQPLATIFVELFHYTQIHFRSTSCDGPRSYGVINTGGWGWGGAGIAHLMGKCSHNQKNISSCDNAGQERKRGSFFFKEQGDAEINQPLKLALSESAGRLSRLIGERGCGRSLVLSWICHNSLWTESSLRLFLHFPPPHVQACASACTHIHTWGGTQGFMHTKQVVYHWATFSHPQNIYWAPTMFQGLCYECAGSMIVNKTGLFPPLENLESRERKSVVTKMPLLGT